MDIRRDWTQDEEDLVRWLRPLRLPHIVVATKADKLSRTELLKRVKILEKDSKAALVLATSVLKDQGFIELEEAIFRLSQGNPDFGDLKGAKNRGPA
jgi:GTP-binding protein